MKDKEQNGSLQIKASVASIDKAKELLDELKALTDKYETTIDLKICPVSQVYYTLN